MRHVRTGCHILGHGDVSRLATLLAEDVIVYTDGGGVRMAALNPIFG